MKKIVLSLLVIMLTLQALSQDLSKFNLYKPNEDAKAAINIEKQAALKEVKIQVAMFSLDIAEKLMKKNLSSDKAQKDLVDAYVKDLKTN